MGHPVFISYARKASRAQAEALHAALGGKSGLAFLDSSGIEPGERFPRVLAEALLASQVVVVFASEQYFQRWYCLWELETVLEPFLALGPRAQAAEKDAALAPIVIALHPKGEEQVELLSLPPVQQGSHWPEADDTPALVKLVHARLSLNLGTLEERLGAAGGRGAGLKTRLLEDAASLPAPKTLAKVRRYPAELPPSIGDFFVGRADDVWRIHYTLSVLRDRRGEGASGAALTGALHGAGGFGKTRLALEYLHRLGPSQHPGGLFWVNAEVGPDRLEEQFHGILCTMDDSVPDLTTFRQSKRNAARELASALESLAARERVLFVVDNVPEPGAEPDEAQKPLETWCPAISKVSLLATSRARLDLGTEGVYGLALSTLSPDAAVALLTEGLGRGRVDEAGWLRIAEWVGHLPLALELLNRAMKAGGLAPEEVLSRATSQEPVTELDQQARFLRKYVSSRSLRGITKAFSLSYERLSLNEQRAARLIAHLAPEPIPLALLEALGEDVASSEVRMSLCARHFVTLVETGAVSLFGSMHRVLASFLRSRSSVTSAELVQACQALLKLMTEPACEDPQAWPLLQACLPHAESVFTRMGRLGAHENIEHEVHLGLRLGLFLSERGVVSRARTLRERIVARAQQLLGPEHLSTLSAMSDLASSHRIQGELEGARVLEEQALEVRMRVLGEEHPDTLTTMHNLTLTVKMQGDLEGARVMGERVLAVSRRVKGEENRDTLTTMDNLAATLWSLGDMEKARALFERVLEVRMRVLGEEHPDTLTTMNNLAATLGAQGHLGGARVMEERVLEVRMRVLSEAHPDTLTTMYNLAQTLKAQGDLGGARALEERVLEVSMRVLGESHPDTLATLDKLAQTLKAQGDQEGARALEERVQQLRRPSPPARS